MVISPTGMEFMRESPRKTSLVWNVFKDINVQYHSVFPVILWREFGVFGSEKAKDKKISRRTKKKKNKKTQRIINCELKKWNQL